MTTCAMTAPDIQVHAKSTCQCVQANKLLITRLSQQAGTIPASCNKNSCRQLAARIDVMCTFSIDRCCLHAWLPLLQLKHQSSENGLMNSSMHTTDQEMTRRRTVGSHGCLAHCQSQCKTVCMPQLKPSVRGLTTTWPSGPRGDMEGFGTFGPQPSLRCL